MHGGGGRYYGGAGGAAYLGEQWTSKSGSDFGLPNSFNPTNFLLNFY